MMKRMYRVHTLTSLVVIGLAMVLFRAGDAGAQPITVDVFSQCQGGPCSISTTGGGAPYSGLVGTFQASAVDFATTTGYNWHPFGQFAFARTSRVPPGREPWHVHLYVGFTDGSLLFIDGNLVVNNGDPHSPNITSGSATLSAGTHSFEVQFFECCSGPSGVDLLLPPGVTYGSVCAAGTPGNSNCYDECVSALAHQFGGIDEAASTLGFPNVKELQGEIKAFCKPVVFQKSR